MQQVYQQATFIMSAPEISAAPKDSGIEVAFAGRSNAGKSSAINALTRQKSLARTSKTPGRTQLLNFFALTEHTRFVDLPGYGYAKVPPSVKKKWHKMIETYLQQRKSLQGIVLVMDIRHPLTEFDQQMISWCDQTEKPLHVLLTKADKLNYGAAKNILLAIQQEFKDAQLSVTIQLFSATKKTGIQELGEHLNGWFNIAQE
jgi:GTP-binding protein